MKRISLFVLIILVLCLLSSCKVMNLSKEDYVKKYYDYHVQQEKVTGCIDLRDLNTDYATGHIKGFINYNYSNGNDDEFKYFVSSLYNKSTYIFLIDSNGEYVVHAAKVLKQEGYKHIIIYQRGYNDLIGYAQNYLQIVEGIDDCGC